MPKENTTRYIILGLLSHENLSGYDIKKQIDMMISRFWDVGYNQIYPTLAGLERDGMVIKSVSQEAKGPQKHIYTITEAGRESLAEWLALPEEKEYTKYGILLKLFFSSEMPSDSSIERIQAFQGRHRQNLNLIRLFKANLENVLGQEKDHLYYYITVLFGEKVYNAYLDWADEALRLLENAQSINGEGEARSRKDEMHGGKSETKNSEDETQCNAEEVREDKIR